MEPGTALPLHRRGHYQRNRHWPAHKFVLRPRLRARKRRASNTVRNRVDARPRRREPPRQSGSATGKAVAHWWLRGVTPTTACLSDYWTEPSRDKKLFFCQIEALETAIYLTEVAHKYGDAWIENQLREATVIEPGLPRMAFKMATGSGKNRGHGYAHCLASTQQVCQSTRCPLHRRSCSSHRASPSATGCVLLPNDPSNYYRQRDIVSTELA